MTVVKIAGTGSYLPKRIVPNSEICPRIESTDEWIVSHTGVKSRHVATDSDTSSTMGAEAARRALTMAGVTAESVGIIIVATTTPDYGNYPSCACLIQKALGCANAAAFDLSAACSGFVYGLEMARCYLLAHPERKAIVIGTEVLSRQMDWSDRTCAMLFGDGAGAVVLETANYTGKRVSASVLGADGNGAEFIRRDGGARLPPCADPVAESVKTVEYPYLKMDGHSVFAFAVRKLDEVVRDLCREAKVAPESLDLIIAHQANLRILDSVMRRMKLPKEKFLVNLETVGNTSSASIPICLDEGVRKGEVKDGMRIALAGFGSGLTWAGALMQWPYL